jgi:tetratricopeptide (TPR) repeat protein
MLKKQRIKLKEAVERITLREAGASASAEPDILAPEDPPLAQSETAQSPAGEAPIKGKFASKLSDEDLTTLATHPDSIEADWLPAFTELEKRTESQNLPTKKGPGKEVPAHKGRGKKYSLLLAATVVVAISSAAYWQFLHIAKAHPDSSGYDPRAPYVLRSAHLQSWQLKQRAVVRLAQTIDARGWTTSKAAAYLGVDQNEIAALMNSGHCSYNMDELDKMLFAVGASTAFPAQATTEELQQTVAYFTRVIAINPQESRAFDERASAYRNLQQYDLAIADLKRYVELNPKIPGSRMNLAALYESAGKHEEALQTLNDQQSLFPDEDIYQNRALVYDSLGQYDKALSDNNTSIAMMAAPRPGPYINRARLYEKLGKYKEAIADCNKVLEIDPTYDSAARLITKLKNKL